MVMRTARWVAALGIGLCGLTASAQEEGGKSGQVKLPPADGETRPADAPRPEAVGAMAAPTETSLDEGPVGEGRKTLVWLGFHPAKSYHRLFLKTSERVAVEAHPGAGEVRIRLKNTRVRLRNNLRHVDTSYFSTALWRITARAAEDDVDVVVQMREVVAYKIKRKGETIHVDFELPAKK